MTEHGWPDHHDDPGYHDEHHDPLHDADDAGGHDAEPLQVPEDDHGFWDVHQPEDVQHDAGYEPHVDTPHADTPPADLADTHETTSVAADPDAQPEYDGTDTVFPPAVDVGPLPEPVDGFPWIDTGSLGVVDPAAVHDDPVDHVDPHELAEYAGTELPPGVDPWAALADSEDPATSALARWWSEQQ
jgi:hypothetical protein